jgi:hypothetical protein
VPSCDNAPLYHELCFCSLDIMQPFRKRECHTRKCSNNEDYAFISCSCNLLFTRSGGLIDTCQCLSLLLLFVFEHAHCNAEASLKEVSREVTLQQFKQKTTGGGAVNNITRCMYMKGLRGVCIPMC